MKRLNENITAFICLIAGIMFCGVAQAQNSTIISGQDEGRRVIITAVPFLNFAPDSRHSAMGDAGVATTPDANSAHWNAAKLAFVEDKTGFSLSYSPWLGKLVPDMSLSYLTGYFRIDDMSTFGVDLRYFNMGDIQLTNGFGEEIGQFNPRDIAIGTTYSRKLSETLSLGISARFIHSNLAGNITSNGNGDSKPGVSVGVDVGVYQRKEILLGNNESYWSWGAMISNIGPKLTYNSAADLDYIPTNLRIGTALETALNPNSKLTFTLDLNKLMVPTPPIYETNEDGTLVIGPDGEPEIESGKDPNRPLLSAMFGSFADAPDGFKEEMQEVMISFGVEYSYAERFALRTGYFYENKHKGGRKYFTMGLGFAVKRLDFDFSYLVPQKQNHPMAETLRFSVAYNIPN